MKKNRTMKVAALLLALTLMTSCFVGGTFARYVSTASLSDTVTVAKWDVQLDANTLDYTETATFDFTETWKDSDGNTEEDVMSKYLAPGTKGSFDLLVENKSDVTAEYKIEFNFSALNDLPLNITYKLNGTETTAAALATFTQIAMTSGSATITVEWEWPFEAVDPNTDAKDTALGLAGGNFALSATLTARQVN